MYALSINNQSINQTSKPNPSTHAAVTRQMRSDPRTSKHNGHRCNQSINRYSSFLSPGPLYLFSCLIFYFILVFNLSCSPPLFFSFKTYSSEGPPEKGKKKADWPSTILASPFEGSCVLRGGQVQIQDKTTIMKYMYKEYVPLIRQI